MALENGGGVSPVEMRMPSYNTEESTESLGSAFPKYLNNQALRRTSNCSVLGTRTERRRSMLRLKDLVVSSAVVSLLAACSGGEEKGVLDRFFMACRSGDNATVASVSQVAFPAEGCEAWELIEVSEPMTAPFRIAELRQKVEEAKIERDNQFEKGKYFLEDNYTDIEKIQLKLDTDPEFKFKGKTGEVQAEWEKIIADRKTLERTVQGFNRDLEKETKLAKMSIMTDVALTKLEGTVITKDIKVTVTSDGQPKPYTFKLVKYDLTNTENNTSPKSRWIITAIDEG